MTENITAQARRSKPVQRNLLRFAVQTICLVVTGGPTWFAAYLFPLLVLCGSHFVEELVIRCLQPELYAYRQVEQPWNWKYLAITALFLCCVGLTHHESSWIVSLGMGYLGWLALSLGYMLCAAAFSVNPFAMAKSCVRTDQVICESGPYALLRHPIYLGNIAIVAGSACILASPIALIYSLVIIAMNWSRATSEDRFLQAHLPGYTAYADRVKRMMF